MDTTTIYGDVSKPMQFSNRENEQVTLADGRVVWLSRSCAVVITVWCRVEGIPYILLGKRGPGCPDEIGKWNLPCGYLDWDETLTEGAEREVFEETGLDIRQVQSQEKNVLLNHMQQPWKVVSSTMNSSKQNVSHHFALVFQAEQLPALSLAHCEPDESDAVEWIAISQLNNFDYAFQHNRCIHEFISYNPKLFNT